MIDPYDLAPEPVAPPLPGSVVVRPEAEDVLDAMAADILVHAESCVRAFGDFHLALSGHPGLDPVYAKLMIDPAYRWLPWARTQLWIVDEHIGHPAGHPRFESIRSSIVQHAGIPVEQVHAVVPGADDPAEAARLYERELLDALGWREKGHDRLDCVVLFADELGHDRAPASGTPGATGDGAGLVSVFPPDASSADEPPASRVGMTERLLGGARFIGVFGSGQSSAPHVARFASAPDATRAPVVPVQGELRWYLDGDAVGFDPAGDA